VTGVAVDALLRIKNSIFSEPMVMLIISTRPASTESVSCRMRSNAATIALRLLASTGAHMLPSNTSCTRIDSASAGECDAENDLLGHDVEAESVDVGSNGKGAVTVVCDADAACVDEGLNVLEPRPFRCRVCVSPRTWVRVISDMDSVIDTEMLRSGFRSDGVRVASDVIVSVTVPLTPRIVSVSAVGE
jgi:hypothetical protein